jgi:hypothetical protein
MKTMITALLFVGTMIQLNAQNSLIVSEIRQCSAVTQRVVSEKYSPEEQESIVASPLRLSLLNNYLTSTYVFADGQMVLRSQKVLFDVTKYEYRRHQTIRVSVYDEISGTEVILLSNTEMEAGISAIENEYSTAKK